MDENKNMNDLLDLGSDPVGEDFDPFEDEDTAEDGVSDNVPVDTNQCHFPKSANQNKHFSDNGQNVYNLI